MTSNSINNGFKNRSAFIGMLAALYTGLLVSLAGVGILVYHNNKAFNTGSNIVTHTRTVLERTDSIQILAQNLQWNALTYSLTGNTTEQQSYFFIRNSLQASTAYLAQLVKDNQLQYSNAVKLSGNIKQLINITDSTFLPEPNVKTTIIKPAINLQQRAELYNAINKQIQLIRTEENRLLVIRRTAVFKTIDITYRLFIASGILVLITLASSFILVVYHFRKRKKAEQGLIQSERKLRTLINSTKDLAIFMIDENGFILSWDEGAHNIKGYTSDEVIGKHISVFYTTESVTNKEPEHNLEVAAQQGSFETEGWRVRKDGSYFWADVLINAIYNDEGKLQGFTKVTRDFTLHKKAEDEIKRAFEKEKELNAMKSNFVSMASHEFRTPLSTILSSVSLLEFYKTAETQDKRDKHIHRIRSAVNELVSTLEEFLSLEKIEEGKAAVKKEIFNLKELAEHVHAKFQTDLKPGQTIEYNHNGKEEVNLDEGFINHILTNLISNAIKYSPPDSKILFETSVNETAIIFIIKDNGIGISDSDQKNLFERFFRASNTGNIKGTGLGLHIVKRYIDLMGGTISLKSELNKGTVFTVILDP